jgi:mono/diheme cytochrome c family protein
MLATVVFLAFWVVVGLGLFFLAVRGGPRGVRATLQSQKRGARTFATLAFTVFYIAVGIAVPALFILGDRDSAEADVNGTRIDLTQQEERGRALFGTGCANCHTLAAAAAAGKVGPNLDVLKPPTELTYDAIVRGRQRGGGTMPAGIYAGAEAEAVAAFVGATAGR